MSDPANITIDQLATELGIPVRTVYAWRSQGKGPVGYRFGKHVRFRRSDIDAWQAGSRDVQLGGTA